ncbi:MAG: hypothetical protein QXV82_08985 [Ignisphaera sp.]
MHSEAYNYVVAPHGKDKNLYTYPTSKYWYRISQQSICSVYVSPSKSIEIDGNRVCVKKRGVVTFCYTYDQFRDLVRILCSDG